MATEFLNDARKEIEGRTEDFCGELKAFYQGNGEAEQNLMEQTTQPFWQSLRLSRKRLQQRELTVDMEMQEPARLADYDGIHEMAYDPDDPSAVFHARYRHRYHSGTGTYRGRVCGSVVHCGLAIS